MVDGHYHYYTESEMIPFRDDTDGAPGSPGVDGSPVVTLHMETRAADDPDEIPSIIHQDHEDWDPDSDRGREEEGGLGIGIPVGGSDTETGDTLPTSRTGERSFPILRNRGQLRRRHRQ